MNLTHIFTAPFTAATWRWTAYSLAALPLGTLWFTLVVTGVSTGGSLAFTLVGLPVLWGTLWLCDRAVRVERAWARTIVGVDLPPAVRKQPASDRWYAPLLARITDGLSWREAAALLVSFVTGTFAFTVAVTVWAIAIGGLSAPIWGTLANEHVDVGWDGNRLDTPYEWAATILVGVLFTLLAPWVVWAVGRLHAAAFRTILGPSREALRAETARLTESRDRSVDAAAAERRRIERDLHDGAQARLVSLAMDLGRTKERIAGGADVDEVAAMVGDAHEEAKRALVELRDLARGIHPAVLTDRGLDAALSGLAARCPVPVTLQVDVAERPPASVEAVAYFVAAEALANVAKHADATQASVTARRTGDQLVVEVRDDGRGGANAGGSGLRGLSDRVQSVDGTLTVMSPPGGPTTILAVLPCG